MSKVVLVQGSLGKDSKTAIVLEHIATLLVSHGIETEILDLRHLDLEFCDGRPLSAYNQDMQHAYAVLESADAYVLGMPVYQYSFSGVLKNFLDITTGAMRDKFAGIVCTAGGQGSYLASAELMKVLSFEVNVMSVQPTVYTSSASFQEGVLVDEKVRSKIEQLVQSLLRFLS